MTEGTVRFRTTEPGTIPAGEISVTVAAEAVEAGSSGNVGAGTVHVLTACPVAVAAVTNEKAFTGGLSEETDEEQQDLCYAGCRELSYYGPGS